MVGEPQSSVAAEVISPLASNVGPASSWVPQGGGRARELGARSDSRHGDGGWRVIWSIGAA